MLTQRADTGVNFTRRELVRLIIASVLLIVTLTATLAIDVAPSGLGLTVGAIAQESVRAPRAITYESAISTKRAKDLASEGVPPQYDYSPEGAASVAAQQGAAFSQSVAGRRRRVQFDAQSGQPADLLRSTLPALTEAAHSRLNTLSPERWQVVRQEAERVLEEIERTTAPRHGPHDAAPVPGQSDPGAASRPMSGSWRSS